MTQTAVEWLVEQIKNPNWISIPTYQWIQQAKEMEKQQTIDFHIDVMKYGLIDEGEAIWKDEYLPKILGIAEQRYNEKYGGNNAG
jgi:hypothetical protein